jgi:hypothetical protein
MGPLRLLHAPAAGTDAIPIPALLLESFVFFLSLTMLHDGVPPETQRSIALTCGVMALGLFSHRFLRKGPLAIIDSGTVIEGAFIYWYVLPLILTSVTGLYLVVTELSVESTSFGYASVSVFGGRYVFVLVMSARRLQLRSFLRDGPVTSFRLRTAVAALLFFLIGLYPYSLLGNPIEVLLRARSASGAYFNLLFDPDSRLYYHLTYGISIAAILSGAAIATRARSSAIRWVAALVLAADIVVLIVGQGTRSLLLPVVVPVVGMLIAGHRRAKLAIVATAVAVVALALLSELAVRYRSTGWQGSIALMEAVEGRILVDNDFFSELAYSMEYIPSVVPFSYESPMLDLVVGVIPRQIWPDKPILKNRDLIMRLRFGMPAGDLKGNILPGIMGQYWQVAGPFGIVWICLLLGLACRWIQPRLSRPGSITQYLLAVWVWSAFIGFRNLASGVFIPVVVATLLMIVMGYVRFNPRAVPQVRFN